MRIQLPSFALVPAVATLVWIPVLAVTTLAGSSPGSAPSPPPGAITLADALADPFELGFEAPGLRPAIGFSPLMGEPVTCALPPGWPAPAPPAGWSDTVVVTKEGWVDVEWTSPACLAVAENIPLASPPIPSPAPSPSLAGNGGALPQELLKCLNTGRPVTPGSAEAVGENITFVYWARDRAQRPPNEFPITVEMRDSHLGLVCEGMGYVVPNDAFARGFYCVAINQGPVFPS
ncbi:MAG: hypothetical protein FWD59_08985 [Micrococcales bacterium]|nr:hypothetical protein [Micrococcales bacterium]